MQTGQSERSICHSCVPLKLMQYFHIFVIFRLVLWILSSLWLNVESGTLLKVMLVICRVLKEVYVLHLSKIKH